MQDDGLVHYRCSAQAHRRPRGAGTGTITVHEGRWAHCESREAGGHEWTRVDPLAFEQLELVSVRPIRDGLERPGERAFGARPFARP